MNKYLFSIITILVIGFSSCYKYSVVDLNPPNTRTTSDSVYLKKYIEVVNYQNPVVIDSFIKYYQLDPNKRVVKWNEAYYENGSKMDTTIVTIDYNGTDTLPFKCTFISYEIVTPNLQDTLIQYFNYNANKKLIKDSLIYKGSSFLYTNYDIKNYTYSANVIYAQIKSYNFINNTSLLNTVQNDTATLNPNGNITKQVSSYSYQGNPSLKTFETTYTYDNKFSATYFLNIRNIFFLNSQKLHFGYANNNILTANEIDYSYSQTNPSLRDQTLNFTYNTLGLPVTSIGFDYFYNANLKEYYYYQ